MFVILDFHQWVVNNCNNFIIFRSLDRIRNIFAGSICRFGNFDDKDLVFVLFHSFVDVCEVDEVIFRDQGIKARVFVVDGN